MAYPTGVGITSMTATYIPAVWSGKTVVKFYRSSVFGAIASTDYEGEIKNQGDTVHIRLIPTITVRDYSIGQKLVRERPATEVVDLLIDKGKYYSVEINDVERAQSDLNYVEKWTDDAGEQMASGTNGVDVDILGNIYSDADASNQGSAAGAISEDINLGVSGTPLEVTKVNILETIVDVGVALGEYDVPKSNIWIVLPEAFGGLIMKSDLKDASLAGDGTSVIRNGRLGMIGRFTIYLSNNLTVTADGGGEDTYNIIAGHPSCVTFASQLVKNRMIPNPDDFGDIMEGLQVYGYKVINDNGLVWLYAYKG